MGELITYGAAILGVLYTIVNSCVIWSSVGMELKGFVSARTKAILILNTVILYLLLVLIIAYYLFEINKDISEFERTIITILIAIMFFILILAVPILIYI
uniref:hypothetical protein n=1 Tax=Listeria marthii TaxID=529731 RepID=UPI00165DF17B